MVQMDQILRYLVLKSLQAVEVLLVTMDMVTQVVLEAEEPEHLVQVEQFKEEVLQDMVKVIAVVMDQTAVVLITTVQEAVEVALAVVVVMQADQQQVQVVSEQLG